MVGVSASMQRLYGLLHQISAYSYPVLITGETGTGKKLAAETVHSLSLRKSKAFVVADFSKIAPTLAESELFGYERGAFAGATHSQWGLLAFARQGTMLLKEVGDLPLHVQARVMQMLHDNEFTPIGSSHPIPFKARVLATTSHDLQAEAKRGRFREDLLLTLNATQINLPPLRERTEDIPLLVDYFLEKYQSTDQPNVKFSSTAMQRLCTYRWPGNVRELEETVRCAISTRSADVIEIGDLELTEQLPDDRRWAAGLTSYFDEREREAIVQALRRSEGDKAAAAKLLGMAESALQKRLQYYHL
jgi:DNA-binding NtrC family response regulator